MFSFAVALLCFSCFSSVLKSDALYQLPVTFYIGELGSSSNAPSEYLYYSSQICTGGMAQKKQAILTVGLPNNVNWTSLTTSQWVAVQVSKCAGSFTPQCVIVTNYLWGSNLKAVPQMIWNVGTETAYYIRVLAPIIPTTFTMELTFGIGLPLSGFNYTTDTPFSGNTASKTPTTLKQYWKSESVYSVPNLGVVHFALAPCKQTGETINSINVAVSSTVNKVRSSFNQWACPQSVQPYTSCNQVSGYTYWRNPFVCAFNFLSCNNVAGKDPTNGIYVGVEGDGAEVDNLNYFTIQGTIIQPPQ